ncbi:signal peptide peptidase SppA [Neomegalonema perideroedes]|uniref:signal peptide peptidase SppA n=1 Tax=Neomegalonema perideroedes TaxID=217219 RepID=UPI0003633660|nr:signal peptide peptidase SppA [Neomegalonema perideroedes]
MTTPPSPPPSGYSSEGGAPPPAPGVPSAPPSLSSGARTAPAGFGAAPRLGAGPAAPASDPAALTAAFAAALQGEEERQRVRRSRGRWRLFGVLTLLLIGGAFLSNSLQTLGKAAASDHIARIRVVDVITSDRLRDAFLRDLAEEEAVKAVVLSIDSPGGTVVGSEELYEALRVVAEAKPLVAVMGEQAASGGYIAALAADHLLARGNSITGSIGVISQSPNFYELAERLGVEMIEVKSAPLKAAPSPFQPVDPAAVAADQAVVNDSYAWFLDLVKERRQMNDNEARSVGDGRVFTGRQALEARLIDGLGGEQEAVAWLESEKEIAEDLEIRNRSPAAPRQKLLIERIAEQLGVSGSAEALSGRRGVLWAIR